MLATFAVVVAARESCTRDRTRVGSLTGAVLINIGNLRTGGALQVAASFLHQLALVVDDPHLVDMYPWVQEELDIWVSDGRFCQHWMPGFVAPGSAERTHPVRGRTTTPYSQASRSSALTTCQRPL